MTDNKMEREYSEESFWDKIKKVARTAGFVVLEPALKMYYSAQDPDTPAQAKAIIYGALGYFILPLDAIPDIFPGGYIDDIGVLMAALGVVATHIKEEHVEKANETLKQWFD